jgi:diguanylate cyclase (GGDEF)-like protein
MDTKMHIESLMSRTVITAEEDAPLTYICTLMEKNYIGSVVIVKGQSPVGIVTERDIVKAVAGKSKSIAKLKAKDIMETPLHTKTPDTEVQEAMDIMKNHRIRRLPITVGGRLAGIITYGDILRFMRKALTDSHSRIKHLESEVDRDTLTGVYSRAYFDRVLKREINRVQEYGGFLSLLMVDVDNLKEINDTYGHAGGDVVLSQVASMTQLNVREINSVCRFGGDEFAVIAPISDINGAIRMGERLRQVIEATIIFYDKHEIKTTLSIGVAAWRSSMENEQDLIKEADKGLYQAKEEGRNKVSA